jgi:hypothetical protein
MQAGNKGSASSSEDKLNMMLKAHFERGSLAVTSPFTITALHILSAPLRSKHLQGKIRAYIMRAQSNHLVAEGCVDSCSTHARAFFDVPSWL